MFRDVIFVFCFSDRRSLKIENENNNTKSLTAEAPCIELVPLEFRCKCMPSMKPLSLVVTEKLT